MGVSQEQSTNNEAARDDIIQLLHIIKQKNLGNKIDYQEAGRLINDIVSASKDEMVGLRRSKRDYSPDELQVLAAEIPIAVVETFLLLVGAVGPRVVRWISNPRNIAKVQKYSRELNKLNTKENREKAREIAGDIVEAVEVADEIDDHYKTLQESTTQISIEGQRESSVQEIVEMLSHFYSEFMAELSGTSEEQVIEEEQGTERQNVTTEIPQVTVGQNVTTEMPLVTRAPNATTEMPRAIERQNITMEVPPVTETPQVIDRLNEDGFTPLVLAIVQDDLNSVKALIERGADVNFKNKADFTALHAAAARGNLEIAQFLLDNGAYVNAKSADGSAPLKMATLSNHSAMEKLLLDHGADRESVRVNERKDDVYDTPLISAVIRDDLHAVKALIGKGDDVNAKNKYGGTPLHAAAIRGNLEIAQFLLNSGADINAQSVNGLTSLNWAILFNQTAMVKLLLDRCADVNIQESESHAEYNFGYGRTPLISAAIACNIELARLLFNHGADASIKGRGLTALDLANTKKDECPEMLTLLEGDNVRSSDNKSNCTSTVQQAVQHGNRRRRDVSDNSWMNNSVVNWVKGFLSSTESPDLLTSREHNNHTITAVPEINTTIVNNTIMLGILATSLKGKKQKLPLHENLLSPIEQSMRLNNLGEVERTIQKMEEKYGPSSSLDDVLVHNNKTWLQK